MSGGSTGNNQFGVVRALICTLALFGLAGAVQAQTGVWETATPMPTAREKLAACAIGQNIYAVGGSAGENQPGMNTLERLNTENGNWTSLSPMPTGRLSLTASVVDDICYVIGGRLNFGGSGFNTVEAFDPATGNWSARAAMPTGRFYPASAAIGGKIYVAGGATNEVTIVDDLEAYDPGTNSWTVLPPMPSARAIAAAAAYKGKLYVMGGTNSPSAQDFNVVEVYDPATRQWSTAAPMLSPRAQSAAVVVDGKIYLIGGGRLAQARDTVQIYDPASDSWSMGPALNDVRVRMAGATVGNTIYAMGGARRVTPPHPGTSSVEMLMVEGGAEPFQINPGLNDAWFNPNTPGQGFFITVFPDSGTIFLAWFTYDTERPPANVEAILGEPGHRWVTAFGNYADDMAVLDIEVTSGGIFNAALPAPTQELDGTIIVEFHDCNSATITYDIPSAGLQGAIQIERIALDNVAVCEALAGN